MKLITAAAVCILLMQAACTKERALYVDSQFTEAPDGSSSAPFPTIRAAIREARMRNYISTRIVVKAGIYHESDTIQFGEGAPFRHAVSIVGDKGGKTIIDDGGFWTWGSIDFSLSDFTFINCSRRAIRQEGGLLHLQHITVRDYRFSADKSLSTPSAVELINVCATIDGLRLSTCDQPNLRIVGPLASIDISNLDISDSRYVMGEIAGDNNYLPAVEVRDGAKAMLTYADLVNAQGIALLIADGIAKLRYVNVSRTSLIAQETASIGTNIMILDSRVQAYRLYASEAATVGLFLLHSTMMGEEVGITNNQFGLWYKLRNDGHDGYRIKDCFFNRPGVEIKKNLESDFINNGDQTVPEKIPVPCPPPCDYPPPPAPVPLPANCYPVEDAVFYCEEE